MNVSYERYRPKLYRPGMSIFWWVKQKPYVLFIVRELTSLFVAAYAVLLIIQVSALSRGPEAWQSLTHWFATPVSILLHVLIIVFIVFHSVTWFSLAPKAMAPRIGRRKVPPGAIVTGNLVMWALLTAAIAWLLITL